MIETITQNPVMTFCFAIPIACLLFFCVLAFACWLEGRNEIKREQRDYGDIP